MSNVALCPNCGGQKTISKPPYIAGDVNRWVSSSMETFPCPTCEGRGWIRVDSVPQEDFAAMKGVALLSMETAENLMDECTKRADRIKELEAAIVCFKSVVKGFNRREEELLETIYDLTGENKRLEIDLELLDEILKVVNPLIKSGTYSRSNKMTTIQKAVEQLYANGIRHIETLK